MVTAAQIKKQFGFGDSSHGLIVVDSAEALTTPSLKGQAHYIRRAFDRLNLDAVVCVDGVPTVLLAKFDKPISRTKVNDLQRKFWNLGTGTLLLLLDPTAMFVFSNMMLPSTETGEIIEHQALVEKLELVADTLESCQFMTRVATGRYYREHSDKFKPANTVDQYLLSNLGYVAELLRRDNSIEERKRVHAFLGRIIFTSYLVDRGIVELADYSFVKKQNVVSLLDLLTACDADTLYKVFEQLREDFNGSMFETDLKAERLSVTDDDISTLVKFLRTGFHRSPAKVLYEPPLVLINDGFTLFSFVDFFTFYSDSLTGISGPERDEDLLRFFTLFVNSKIAIYFLGHIAGSLGIERPHVRVHELMRLPFPLPGSPNSHKDAEAIVTEVASRMKALQTEVALEYAKADSADDFELRAKSLAETRRVRVEQLQVDLEPLVYKYFKLNKYEIMHIEDTCEIISPSATPTSPTVRTKTTDPTSANERWQYADLLCKTLNKWSESDRSRSDTAPFYFAAELASYAEIGMVLLTLMQAESPTTPTDVTANGQLQKVIDRITKSSSYEQGSFSYLRGKIFASGKKIHILKQDMRVQWMRTSALNDADMIFQAIVTSSKKKRK